MSAEVETMMYTNEVPWHGLGTYVGNEGLSAEEAIIKAGLDWEVEKCPAYALAKGGNEEIEVGDWYFNVRSTDMEVLGAVQKGYKVLQNVDAFNFMDSLSSDGLNIQYHTAGSLAGGSKVWLLAKASSSIEVLKGDAVDPYILLVSGHDGRTPLKVLFTSVRVVCQNTLRLALKAGKNGIVVRHTASMDERISTARVVMQAHMQELEAFKEVSTYLAGKKLDEAAFQSFLRHMVEIPEDASSRKRVRATSVRQVISSLYEDGPGSEIPGVTGSAWGALQAFTNYTTHSRATRGNRLEGRLNSTWFGSSDALNQKALKYLADA